MGVPLNDRPFWHEPFTEEDAELLDSEDWRKIREVVAWMGKPKNQPAGPGRNGDEWEDELFCSAIDAFDAGGAQPRADYLHVGYAMKFVYQKVSTMRAKIAERKRAKPRWNFSFSIGFGIFEWFR